MLCTKDITPIVTILPNDSFHKKYSTTLIYEIGKKLLQCAKDGDKQGVSDLLGKGAPFTTDWLGTSPLHLAAMNNHYDICEILLRAGVVRDGKTKVDRTPLHFAAYEGYADIADLLLNHGAEADVKDMLLMTPLHWAVEKGHLDCVKILLNHGADPNAVSRFNKTPLSIAMEMEWNEVVQLLLKSQVSGTDNLKNIFSQETEQIKDPPVKFSIDYDELLLNLPDKHIEDNINSMETDNLDTDKDLASLLPPVDESPNEATLQLLKEHGITMLPADNTNTVNSAIQSGRKIVLSDAGKLVLKDVNLQKSSTISKPVELKKNPIIVPSSKLNSAQIYAVTSGNKLVPVTNSSLKPNILQKLQLSKNVVSPMKVSSMNNKKIKIVNGIKGVSNVTLVKNANGELFNPAGKSDVIRIGQTNPKIFKLKEGSVKIVMKPNNIIKPENVVKLNRDNNLQESVTNDVVLSLDNSVAPSNGCEVSKDKEIERLNLELTTAKEKIDFYKKKLDEANDELAIFRSKLYGGIIL